MYEFKESTLRNKYWTQAFCDIIIGGEKSTSESESLKTADEAAEAIRAAGITDLVIKQEKLKLRADDWEEIRICTHRFIFHLDENTSFSFRLVDNQMSFYCTQSNVEKAYVVDTPSAAKLKDIVCKLKEQNDIINKSIEDERFKHQKKEKYIYLKRRDIETVWAPYFKKINLPYYVDTNLSHAWFHFCLPNEDIVSFKATHHALITKADEVSKKLAPIIESLEGSGIQTAHADNETKAPPGITKSPRQIWTHTKKKKILKFGDEAMDFICEVINDLDLDYSFSFDYYDRTFEAKINKETIVGFDVPPEIDKKQLRLTECLAEIYYNLGGMTMRFRKSYEWCSKTIPWCTP